MLESVRERKGLLGPESVGIGERGCWWWLNEAWRENANLRSLPPNPKSPFRVSLASISIDENKRIRKEKPKFNWGYDEVLGIENKTKQTHAAKVWIVIVL